MQYLPNIEKSAFRRGEYVGYSGGKVYRVRKHGCGGWVRDGAHTTNSARYLRADTLGELSAKLAAGASNV